MAIQLNSGAAEQPAIALDHVHMINLYITQPIFSDDTQTAVYKVEIFYKFYGIQNGVRYYEVGEPRSLVINDYIPLAMNAAGQGDNTLINALQSIEAAVATVLVEQAGLDASMV